LPCKAMAPPKDMDIHDAIVTSCMTQHCLQLKQGCNMLDPDKSMT